MHFKQKLVAFMIALLMAINLSARRPPIPRPGNAAVCGDSREVEYPSTGPAPAAATPSG